MAGQDQEEQRRRTTQEQAWFPRGSREVFGGSPAASTDFALAAKARSRPADARADSKAVQDSVYELNYITPDVGTHASMSYQLVLGHSEHYQR